MKKVIIGILLAVGIAVILFVTWYNRNAQTIREVQNLNTEFEGYLNRTITGVDLTTIMNKAIENNNQYEVPKNSDGTYQDDQKYSIQILVKPTEEGKFYPMEAFEKVGMKDFTKNFGGLVFQSQKVEYHTNGRVSKIYFELEPKTK